MTAGLDTGFGGYAGRLPFQNLARYGLGVALQVVDFAVWEANGKADASGQITLQSDPVPGDEFWLADRLNLDSSSLFSGRLDLYEGDSPNTQHRRDWAPFATRYPLHRAYMPALLFRPNRPITLVLSNLAQGDAIVSALVYVVVKRVTRK